MDESELVKWMRQVESRLRVLEGEPTSTAAQTQPVTPTLKWQQVSGLFCRRYEKARNLMWHYSPHVQALEDIAAWCNCQSGEAVKVAERLLDAFFADEYAKLRDYPPRLLASQCGRYYNPPAVALKDEPNEEAVNARRIRDRRMEDQRALEAKLDSHAQTASKPPALEELLAKIGRQM